MPGALPRVRVTFTVCSGLTSDDVPLGELPPTENVMERYRQMLLRGASAGHFMRSVAGTN